MIEILVPRMILEEKNPKYEFSELVLWFFKLTDIKAL